MNLRIVFKFKDCKLQVTFSNMVFETWFSPNHISSNRIPLLIKMFELIGNNQKTEKLQNVGKTV